MDQYDPWRKGNPFAPSIRDTRAFDMTGRPMKGWILVADDGVKTSRQLGEWVPRGVQFAGSLAPKD